ncbi:MarR family transcriptional regulator [Sinomonas cellulolyticus]|uniref:MarR family transcriptional regulator n=1 Tax=Sinomonas cellulolyticus TaxID=2801916 RepID=A0ABS1K3S1_9MICC|nr:MULTISPECIES: MarR family transcriptional regulator [Sinomonas]MBL0706098.1 MarR family transcriptional regulator [Sinomonas cellulolyticus]GHG43464.1 MarR family transcriptional regulator [Sinomonas sp. KCTC 49339]
MQSPGASDPELVGRFSVLLEQLVRRLRTVYAAGQISQSAASTLARLRDEGPLRITDLAHAEGVSQPAMTQLVARLEGEGLLARRVPEGDRRSVLVDVSAAGRDVLEARRAQRVEFLQDLLAGLDRSDWAAIAAALPALERLVASEPNSSRQSAHRKEP